MLSQPTDSTCGPTCLHAVYDYWQDPIELPELIGQVGELQNGGILAVQLACHALQRGYDATIYTYNLYLFDPTWFPGDRDTLTAKLQQQRRCRAGTESRIEPVTEHYLRFLELGGQVRMEVFEEALLVRSLMAGVPVLSGLSATFLYQESRERAFPPNDQGISSVVDDVGGDPVGHFVVLSGYDPRTGQVMVHDPQAKNPFSPGSSYAIPLAKVSASILLGIATYDANLLMIRPATAAT